MKTPNLTFKLVLSGFIALLILAWSIPAKAATITAASCNQSDVNAVINGPIHTAVDGDTINIPAGSCTWTSGISVPSAIGISIIGSGTPNFGAGTVGASSSCGDTVLTDDISNGSSMISMSPNYKNSLSRISCIKLLPTVPNPGFSVPILVNGNCTSSGCPNLRLDNIIAPSSWAGIGVSDDSVARVANMFGVADHSTIGDVQGADNGVDFVNITHGAWGGVGQYGDNSWASPDMFGTAQAFYVENNTFNYAFATDTDGGPTFENSGGSRFVCRYNTVNNVTGATFCADHGTETTGRPRGGRQIEAYGNTLSCTGGIYCTVVGMRSGVAMIFGNSISASGAWWSNIADIETQREWRPTSWPMCDGTGPFDVNDGEVTAYTGTIASVGTGTISVSGTPWTAGAYNFSSSSPQSKYYVAYDEASGDIAGITSNTSSALTFSWVNDQLGGTLNGNKFQAGDTFVILGSTLYQAGTMTGATGSQTLTDSTKNWTTNQWAVLGDAYSVIDVATGNTYQVGSNASNTLTYYDDPFPVWTWTNGDPYVITRATECLDRPTASAGQLYSGNPPLPVAASTETSDPTYEFDDTIGGGATPVHGIFSSTSMNLIADRDYYFMNSSFNGSSGTGFGTLANRPSTCTPHVGYWATDQGNWNQSGSGGQGQLYVCSAPNTWTAYYTPYVYPHPLDSSTTSGTSTYSLVVSNAGTGFGMVFGATTSNSDLINCGVNTGATICSATVNASTAVNLTATPASGSTFSGWSMSGSSGTCTGTTSPCTLTVSATTSVSANFTSTAPSTYTITASAGTGGTISPSGSVSVNSGSSQTFTVTPNTGYTASLDVDGSAVTLTNNTYTLSNVTTNHTVTATFIPIPPSTYTLGVTAANGTVAQSVSGVASTSPYNAGTVVTLTTTPATGYQFTSWSGAVTGTSNPTTMTMNANESVTANFTLKTFLLTVSAGSNGTISPSGSVSVNYGASQAFTVTPNTGYTASLTVDGSAVTLTNKTYTLSNVTANHTVTAGFTLSTPSSETITASAGTGGTISPSGSVSVANGANQTFTVTPNSGYSINQVLVDGKSATLSTTNTYTFSDVTASHTITASFTQKNPFLNWYFWHNRTSK